MAEEFNFPVAVAQERVVPAWQRCGELVRLPDPRLRNDALLFDSLLSGKKVGTLLRTPFGKERVRGFIEGNSELFYYLALTRQELLDELGFFSLGSFTEEPDDLDIGSDDFVAGDVERAFEDARAAYRDELEAGFFKYRP